MNIKLFKKLIMLKTPSQNRALITVQNLLQSSVIILNQDLPLSKFTTRMLSAKSGYSVGSIYQYFTNKEEIFYALIQQDIDELKNKVNKIYLSNSFLNHKEVIKFLIGDCIDLIDKNRIVRVKLINWLLSQPKKNDMAKLLWCVKTLGEGNYKFAEPMQLTFKNESYRLLYQIVWGE